MIEQGQRFHGFDEYRLDTLKHQLLKNGALVPLKGKPVEILQYLVQNAGRVVTRHELLSALWRDTNVTDRAIAVYINKIRNALGDRPEQPRYILTISGSGYKFIGEVNAEVLHQENGNLDHISSGADETQELSVAKTADPVREKKRIKPAVGITLAVVGVFFLYITFALVSWSRAGRTTPQRPHIERIVSLTPPIAGQQFYITLTGFGIAPNTVRVVVTGRGCDDFGSCVVPNNVLHWYGTITSSQLERVPLTLAPGDFQVFVQNGTNGQPSNGIALTVEVN